MLEKLQGFKTYIVTGVAVILVVLQMSFGIVVPESVWVLLGALGLGFIRDALNHLPKK
jgi:hypothetical protein